DNLVLAGFPEGERFILAWMRIFLWEMGMLSLSFAGPAMAAADALSIVAAERLTFYHGTSRYVAMEMAESQAVNIERLAMHQADKAFAKGLYTSSQEATANYYADLLFASGRAGGPAIVKIEVPKKAFMEFAAKRNIAIEKAVPRPPVPGQTETFIPAEYLQEFNKLLGLKISIK